VTVGEFTTRWQFYDRLGDLDARYLADLEKLRAAAVLEGRAQQKNETRIMDPDRAAYVEVLRDIASVRPIFGHSSALDALEDVIRRRLSP